MDVNRYLFGRLRSRTRSRSTRPEASCTRFATSRSIIPMTRANSTIMNTLRVAHPFEGLMCASAVGGSMSKTVLCVDIPFPTHRTRSSTIIAAMFCISGSASPCSPMDVSFYGGSSVDPLAPVALPLIPIVSMASIATCVRLRCCASWPTCPRRHSMTLLSYTFTRVEGGNRFLIQAVALRPTSPSSLSTPASSGW